MKSELLIEISWNGEVTGTMTHEAFTKGLGCVNDTHQDVIALFNREKAASGGHAKQVLYQNGKKVW